MSNLEIKKIDIKDFGCYKDYKQLVVLVRVLPFDVNLGYTDAEHEIIVKVNGEKYKDFKDFAQKVKNVKSEFIIFEKGVILELCLIMVVNG